MSRFKGYTKIDKALIVLVSFLLVCVSGICMEPSRAEDGASGIYTDGDVSYTWELADGNVSITAISCDADRYEVNFPDEIEGHPVTSIPWEYFYCHSNIPERQVKGITAVRFPDGITEIPWYAMKGMINLESVTVSDDNPGLTSSDGVLFSKDMTVLQCYPANMQGSKYVIPDSVTSIRENAFSCTQNLEEVSLPDGVTQLYYAFDCCDSIRTIDLNMVSFMGGSEILKCRNLEKVTVSENNTSIFEYDNVLYFSFDMFGCSPEGTTLLFYPPGRGEEVYIIPETAGGRKVTSILDNAFAYSRLREIIFPESLIKVNNQAFSYSEKLTTLVFPENVENLGFNILNGCSGVRYMYVPESVTAMDYCTSGGPEDIRIYGRPGSAAETYVNNGDMGCFFIDIDKEKIPQDITLHDRTVQDKLVKLEDGTYKYEMDLADEISTVDLGASARSGVVYSCEGAGIDENGIVTVTTKGTARVKITAVVKEGDEKYFAPTEMIIDVVVNDSSKPAPAAQKIKGSSKFTKTYGTKAFALGQSAMTKLTYKSSNTKVASVNSRGTVTLRSPGKAVITVTAAGTDEYLAASKKITIVSALKTPSVKCSAGRRKVRISWAKVKGAKGYQIYVKYPGKKKYVKVLTTSAKVKAVTHKKLSKGLNYTYKVRAYCKTGGKTYYSKFSKARKVKVK